MKKLVLLIFICSIFNLVTSDEPQVTQVLKQVTYYDGECKVIDTEQHIVLGFCYNWGSMSKKYFLIENKADDSTYVRMEKFEDNDCQTTYSNTTSELGCTTGDRYSYSFTLEPVTGDILVLGSDFDYNANCDDLYQESYMTDYCYGEDEESNRITRAGNVAYHTYYSDPSCSVKDFRISYALGECKEWKKGFHETFFLIVKTDSSNDEDKTSDGDETNSGDEPSGGVVSSINFVLLFSFLIVNSLFFLN
ncbi:hypothetical protein M0813_09701 [Anaeramoeba flamelloides]|uniref:Uncharacterized protein n=1 Tax=Anaeramoeba flamelloides TaxID=1746091 RepID=A0ABQ8X626_9EUKA|nr:hypothetical protein M0813_09701 [Anaeramoeba flamelloides]